MTTFNKLLDMKGRLCLITGASGSIGSVLSETICELGADLIIVDKDLGKLNKLKKTLEKKWENNIYSYECDIEYETERKKLFRKINAKFSNLNCLVNNAAFTGSSKLKGWNEPLEKQSLETWRRAFEVNLTAAFHFCQLFFPLLKISKGSNIINISSIYGDYAPDWSIYENTSMNNPAAYSVSKAGLNHLTKYLASYFAPNVRVNTISPGGMKRNQDKQFVKKYKNKTLLKRMSKEDDLRGALAYLATDLSEYVTGQNLRVDGGWGI